MPPPLSGLAVKHSSTIGLLKLAPTPPPDLNYRQEVTRSQSNFFVTLSITRDTTTFTTVIVLGGTEAPSFDPTTNSPWPTTTAVPGSFPTNSVPATHFSSETSSQVIIGAVLGSIFGSLLVLFLIWFCCYSPYAPKLNALNPFYRDGRGGFSIREGKNSYTRPARRGASSPVRIIRVEAERFFGRERIELVGGHGGERPSAAQGPRDRDVRPLGRRFDGSNL